MEDLISQLISVFDLSLCVSIVMLTYIILLLIDKSPIKSNKLLKHVITITITLILSIVYYIYVSTELKQIIPTYLLSTAFYNSIIKAIFSKFNIGYSKDNTTIK